MVTIVSHFHNAKVMINNFVTLLDLSSWRSLGDVVASMFALGYHENIQNKPDVPAFLVELRRTAFGRVYSADKNVAIFLGRPPRMSKRFCYFQIPSSQTIAENQMLGPPGQSGASPWSTDAKMDYISETRWSALCASLKEEILELFFCEDRSIHASKARLVSKPFLLSSQKLKTPSEISHRAEVQWQALPADFRLIGSLTQLNYRTPFERDFMASTRLNHLHVQFLLRLVLLTCLTEPDGTIVEIAQQMLALTVETILLRDHLANSGTGLIWKVC